MVRAGRQPRFLRIFPVHAEHFILVGAPFRGLDKNERDVLFLELRHIDVCLIGGNIHTDRAAVLMHEPLVDEDDLFLGKTENSQKNQGC